MKEMKKVRKAGTVFVIAAVVVLVGITMIAGRTDEAVFSRDNTASAMGKGMKDAVNRLVENSSVKDGQGSMGIVLGETVSKNYLYWEYSVCKATGSENPAQRAWELIRQEVYERQLAEREGLLPTEKEILEYVKEMRRITESAEESRTVLKTIIAQMGMTEDEYWNNYQAKYEAPLQLIRGRVEAYLTENNLPPIDTSKIEAEITDMEFYQSFVD